MEDHKAAAHPNVWCSHFEFSGDQRELYKHLYLPGRNLATEKARNAVLPEKVCTKCTKNCHSLAELHRHMLECGGDQAWLLGLFGNGKKKCKWRPFGSRSRRRRQRGMKRNIQNSQMQRVTIPKEKQPTGPRVRPSDRKNDSNLAPKYPFQSINGYIGIFGFYFSFLFSLSLSLNIRRIFEIFFLPIPTCVLFSSV